MALDIARGVLTEIDEMIGFIARQGERSNMPVPNCARRLPVGQGARTRAAGPRR